MRAKQWKQIGDEYQIPISVAVQVAAGLIREEGTDSLRDHPERANWRQEYLAEIGQSKHPLAPKIATALGLHGRAGTPDIGTAFAVFNGTRSAYDAWQDARDNERRWEAEAEAEKIVTVVVPRVSLELAQSTGIPEEMARQAVGQLSQSPRDWLSAEILEIAKLDWARRLDASGFATIEELVAAWTECGAWSVDALRRARAQAIRKANAGMQPDRVAELCASDRIESTLSLVFHLNHWAKARKKLLYDDRQGLYKIKARILEDAFRRGLIQSVAHIDDGGAFAPFADTKFEIKCVAEGIADLLYCAFEHPDWNQGSWGDLFPLAQQIYRQATGRDVTLEDVPVLGEAASGGAGIEAVEEFIARRLQELQDEAQATRQPVPVRELEALMLSPGDIPAIAYNSEGDSRWRHGAPAWEELDEADLSALDPEWRSLVGFRYESPTACYVFHLPLRTAERFVPADEIRRLSSGGQARESGEYFGRAITEEESLAHPVRELLEQLGVEVDLVCPSELQDKQDYIAEKTAGRWDFYADEYDEDEEDWLDSELDELDDRFAKDLARMDKQIKRRASEQDQCPRCRIKVGAGAVRFEHWHSAHPDVESVTVKHAAWLLGLDKSAFETLGISPDFRAAVDRAGKSVARHWRIETLEMAFARSTN